MAGGAEHWTGASSDHLLARVARVREVLARKYAARASYFLFPIS